VDPGAYERVAQAEVDAAAALAAMTAARNEWLAAH
jgi:hypothetical protein